jgi:hypothetical protein
MPFTRTRDTRCAPEDEPERLWCNAAGEIEQRIANHGRRVERHEAVGFRIGPSDRAEVDGDVAHVRKGGADGLRDDARLPIREAWCAARRIIGQDMLRPRSFAATQRSIKPWNVMILSPIPRSSAAIATFGLLENE